MRKEKIKHAKRNLLIYAILLVLFIGLEHTYGGMYLNSFEISESIERSTEEMQPSTVVQAQTAQEQPTQEEQSTVTSEEDIKAQLSQQVLDMVTYPGMSQMEIVVAVNEYLCNIITYDTEYYTTVDVLTIGKARCQGYANAFKSIMTQAGIPTDYVRGYVGGTEGSHAWNRVLIDGVYYCVDVTWNDSMGENNWLLVPETEFNQDRQTIEYNPSWTEW